MNSKILTLIVVLLLVFPLVIGMERSSVSSTSDTGGRDSSGDTGGDSKDSGSDVTASDRDVSKSSDRKQRVLTREEREIAKKLEEEKAAEEKEEIIRDFKIRQVHKITRLPDHVDVDDETIDRLYEQKERDRSAFDAVTLVTSRAKDPYKTRLMKELLGMDARFVKKYNQNIASSDALQKQTQAYLDAVEKPVREVNDLDIAEVFQKSKSVDVLLNELFE